MARGKEDEIALSLPRTNNTLSGTTNFLEQPPQRYLQQLDCPKVGFWPNYRLGVTPVSA